MSDENDNCVECYAEFRRGYPAPTKCDLCVGEERGFAAGHSAGRAEFAPLVKDAMALIADLEWSGITPHGAPQCPSCYSNKESGHADDCDLRRLQEGSSGEPMLLPSRDDLPHPMQPIGSDPEGRPRFKENAIVNYLLDEGPFDLNHLSRLRKRWPDGDYTHLMQLIGYSVSGYGELSTSPKDLVRAADNLAARHYQAIKAGEA